MQVTERAAFFDPVFVRNTACWPHGTRGDGTSEREPRLVLWIVLCMRTRGDRVLGPTTPVRYARPDSIGLRARTGRAGKTGRTGRTRFQMNRGRPFPRHTGGGCLTNSRRRRAWWRSSRRWSAGTTRCTRGRTRARAIHGKLRPLHVYTGTRVHVYRPCVGADPGVIVHGRPRVSVGGLERGGIHPETQGCLDGCPGEAMVLRPGGPGGPSRSGKLRRFSVLFHDFQPPSCTIRFHVSIGRARRSVGVLTLKVASVRDPRNPLA